ncbi:hypothetical protein [Streptomyces venezuelae]|uniref:hypothetical protein n=1 Tax=Streptomyces venezuelae TaxID=54571 RepID=UPI00168D9A0E|nr:hypothetical protein [Streptomyces venezuelae]
MASVDARFEPGVTLQHRRTVLGFGIVFSGGVHRRSPRRRPRRPRPGRRPLAVPRQGRRTFTARTRIGGGWQEYDEIVGIGDADRDGRADLLVDGKGLYRGQSLAYYKGTGDVRAPFAPRRKLSTPDAFNHDNGLVF